MTDKYTILHNQNYITIYSLEGKVELGFDDGVGSCGEGSEQDAKALCDALNKVFKLTVFTQDEMQVLRALLPMNPVAVPNKLTNAQYRLFNKKLHGE